MRDNQGNWLNITGVKAQAAQACNVAVRNSIVERIHHPDPTVARNAAWVMTHFAGDVIDSLRPRLNELIDVIIATSNCSLQRLLLNIVERMHWGEEALRTDFLDFCFDRMLLPTVAPGIQSLCMKLALRQCQLCPELLPEFKMLLESMEGSYATSTMSLRRKFLKLLRT